MADQLPNSEQVRQALAAIVASAGFADAGRLPSFLTYLVERQLAGETDRLKESVLGVEVFQREAGYDPRTDPIVRVEARRLRGRLDDYYASTGKDDLVRILLPKGAYVPTFQLLPPPANVPPPSQVAAAARSFIPEGSDFPKGRKLALVIAGLAVVGISLGYCQTSYMRRMRQAPAATVAVLPFANVGNDPENEYFSEGLTEEIIDRLARVPGLKVVSRSVMAQFRGKSAPLDQVANTVKASVVIEGSVRRQGDRLRVVARLANAGDGSSLWSQTYDRRTADVFAIQDEIAQSVANALRVQVRGGPPPRTGTTTTNIDAYNALLKGRYQANLFSLEGMRRAIAYYEDALKLQPDYAPALAGLSTVYAVLGYYEALPASEAWPKARQAAESAIRLDPGLADAHAALGQTLAFHDWRWKEATAEFRKALELDDSSALAHGLYAVSILMPNGKFQEAEAEFRRSLALDPLSSFNNFTFAFCLLANGKMNAAIQQYERTLELRNIHPDMYWDYGMALGFAGRYEEAADAMRKARQADGGAEGRLHGLQAWFAGDFEQARQDAPELEKAVREGREQHMDAGRYYAMIGDTEKALMHLDAAVGTHEPQAILIKCDPRFKSLRADARYLSLIRRIGLDPQF
jgi:serine/threonine-protein kinase